MDRSPICSTNIQHTIVTEHTTGPHPGPDSPEKEAYER
jgi:hypothetical protein